MAQGEIGVAVRAVPGGVAVAVKVVAGASRSRLAGLLGDRLKVAVGAAAEGGRANRAVCELLAKALGCAARDITIVAGHTQPLKTIEVEGLTLCEATRRLSAAVQRG